MINFKPFEYLHFLYFGTKEHIVEIINSRMSFIRLRIFRSQPHITRLKFLFYLGTYGTIAFQFITPLFMND